MNCNNYWATNKPPEITTNVHMNLHIPGLLRCLPLRLGAGIRVPRCRSWGRGGGSRCCAPALCCGQEGSAPPPRHSHRPRRAGEDGGSSVKASYSLGYCFFLKVICRVF